MGLLQTVFSKINAQPKEQLVSIDVVPVTRFRSLCANNNCPEQIEIDVAAAPGRDVKTEDLALMAKYQMNQEGWEYFEGFLYCPDCLSRLTKGERFDSIHPFTGSKRSTNRGYGSSFFNVTSKLEQMAEEKKKLNKAEEENHVGVEK